MTFDHFMGWALTWALTWAPTWAMSGPGPKTGYQGVLRWVNLLGK